MRIFSKDGLKSVAPTPARSPNASQKIRICLIGDKSAGKTSLIKYVLSFFPPSLPIYLPRQGMALTGR